MKGRRVCNLFLKTISCFTALLLINARFGSQLSETEAFFNFIKAVDPQNVLGISWNGAILPHPCSHEWKGVMCSLQSGAIREIRLEGLSLGGTIDADSLCKLPNLRVLSLARNMIQGTIPRSILNCRKLTYLNLSTNLLSGTVSVNLAELKDLKTFDISNNRFSVAIPSFVHDLRHLDKHSIKESVTQMDKLQELALIADAPTGDEAGSRETSPPPLTNSPPSKRPVSSFFNTMLIVVGVGFVLFFFFLLFYGNKRVAKMAKEKEILKTLSHSPQTIPPTELKAEIKPEDKRSELVFFVEEQERFTLDDLYEATADLRSQTLCSSLYKVELNNKVVYAVESLKKVQVSFEEFGQAMRQIGNLRHPNILQLVGYNSTSEEKLLIFKYQSHGSVLNLLEDYIVGKKNFPWKLRLSIARGIARGLDFIYQNPDYQDIIPHGNLKLSNILLDENEEPLISEYGFSRFLDPNRSCFVSCNGYTAPEKTLSEQGDVYSFGIILLELLTGKTVEKTGIDLPKWVRAMVREEWTGEVFDKEVGDSAKEYAFAMLNIALKCISLSPEDRPNMAEVAEKIEEILVANGQDDVSFSSLASKDSIAQDWSLLHTVIPETWDTPGSNY